MELIWKPSRQIRRKRKSRDIGRKKLIGHRKLWLVMLSLSPVMSTCCPSSSPITSADDASNMSTGGTPSSLIAGGGLLSAVSGCFSSLIAGGGLLSAFFGRSLSFVASGGPLSTIFGRSSSSVTSDDPSSAVSDSLLSLIAGGGPLFPLFGTGLLFPISPAGSWALFLTSTPSRARYSSLPSLSLFHSFLPSLSTLLTRNPTPLTGKRLFNQVFITQRPITSTQKQEELDLSFR